MATITITIPDDKVTWVLDGIGLRYNYKDIVKNPLFDDQIAEDPQTNPSTIPNPETKAAFAKRQLIKIIKNEATQGHINDQWVIIRAQQDLVNLT